MWHSPRNPLPVERSRPVKPGPWRLAPIASAASARAWLLAGLLALVAGGCGSVPNAPAAPASPARTSVAKPTCLPCTGQAREIERARLELAVRDAELRDLRSSHRDQVKVLQESKREVARAKVKVRRLATRADAASYIAEVEVGLARLRSRSGGKSTDPRIEQAGRLLESTDAPFAQGEYGVAMDRASEAEQLIGSAADAQAQRATLTRKPESHPRVKVATKATTTPKSRGQAPGNARNAGAPKDARPQVASAD
jgi:hypothetical protein